MGNRNTVYMEDIFLLGSFKRKKLQGLITEQISPVRIICLVMVLLSGIIFFPMLISIFFLSTKNPPYVYVSLIVSGALGYYCNRLRKRIRPANYKEINLDLEKGRLRIESFHEGKRGEKFEEKIVNYYQLLVIVSQTSRGVSWVFKLEHKDPSKTFLFMSSSLSWGKALLKFSKKFQIPMVVEEKEGVYSKISNMEELKQKASYISPVTKIIIVAIILPTLLFLYVWYLRSK